MHSFPIGLSNESRALGIVSLFLGTRQTGIQAARRAGHAADDDRYAAPAESGSHARRRRRRLSSGQRRGVTVQRAGDHPARERHCVRPRAPGQLGGGLREGHDDRGPEHVFGRQGVREHVPHRRSRNRTALSPVPNVQPRWRQSRLHRLQRSAHSDAAVSCVLAGHPVHASAGGSREVRHNPPRARGVRGGLRARAHGTRAAA